MGNFLKFPLFIFAIMKRFRRVVKSALVLVAFYFTGRKRYQKNYCYHKTVFLYDFLRSIDISGNYRINIVIETYRDEWGHAWLTRNDKPFPKRKAIYMKIEKVCQNSRFQYWIAT